MGIAAPERRGTATPCQRKFRRVARNVRHRPSRRRSRHLARARLLHPCPAGPPWPTARHALARSSRDPAAADGQIGHARPVSPCRVAAARSGARPIPPRWLTAPRLAAPSPRFRALGNGGQRLTRHVRPPRSPATCPGAVPSAWRLRDRRRVRQAGQAGRLRESGLGRHTCWWAPQSRVRQDGSTQGSGPACAEVAADRAKTRVKRRPCRYEDPPARPRPARAAGPTQLPLNWLNDVPRGVAQRRAPGSPRSVPNAARQARPQASPRCGGGRSSPCRSPGPGCNP